MLKWTVLIVVLAFGGYAAYDAYKAGYHTRPTMPEGAFSLSYKNGLRGIVVGVPYERETRRYLGLPMQVPFYLEDSWSWCSPPTKEESVKAVQLLKPEEQHWPGRRIEAVCKITVEGQQIVRGIIITVPRV